MNEIIVIGTGPAGLMASITASSKVNKVLVLEKCEKPAKKLLISGSGQCNLTHSGDIAMLCEHYGEKKKIAHRILKRFSNRDLITFFNRLGLKLIKRQDGKYFPESFKSSDVVNCLLQSLTENKAKLILNCPVISLEKTNDVFIVSTKKGKYTAKTVICGTGGFTYPNTGSDGSFLSIPMKMGHHIVPLRKGLTPVFTNDNELHKLSGISIENAGLTVKTDKLNVLRKRGELLITHKGFSGPLIIDNSRYLKEDMIININFTSYAKPVLLEKSLLKFASDNGGKTVASFFYGIEIPKRLINSLFSMANIEKELSFSQLSKEKRKTLVDIFASYPVCIKGLGDINEAMVTTGGIDLTELKLSTMESKIIKNLHFCGEMIDIDGDSGGYNIQMAFSTGFIAGNSVSQRS